MSPCLIAIEPEASSKEAQPDGHEIAAIG